MSAAETGAAIGGLYQAGFTVGAAAAWSQLPIDALGVMAGVALPAAATQGALARGEYDYDQIAEVWVKTGDSDDLALNWLHGAVAYRLAIDWDATAPTVMVTERSGATSEMPTGAAAVLTKGGAEVGGLTLAAGWTSNRCDFDEPTSAMWSGYLGDTSARLTLDRLGFSLTDTAGTDTVTAAAEATATVGGDSLSAYLEVTGTGEIIRDVDCNIVGFAPSSGGAALGVTASVARKHRSLDFQTAFSDPEYEADMLTGIGLDGSLRLDGVPAVSFVGAFNDANGNGVPGDELQLTFADDQTMTLEEFIIDQVGWGPLAALRLMSR